MRFNLLGKLLMSDGIGCLEMCVFEICNIIIICNISFELLE